MGPWLGPGPGNSELVIDPPLALPPSVGLESPSETVFVLLSPLGAVSGVEAPLETVSSAVVAVRVGPEADVWSTPMSTITVTL